MKNRDAYEIIKSRWYREQPLKVEEFTVEELEDAIDQGCSERNFISYMHDIAKQVQKLRKGDK